MAKTQEELKKLKEEYKILSTKLQELTEEELNIVTGGIYPEHNIMLAGEFKNNSANGDGGCIYNEGKF